MVESGQTIDDRPDVPQAVVLLLAVVAGTSVAGLYYAQPLLDTIGTHLGVSAGLAGLLVTASQIGYVIGLAFLVPLGDVLERRRLVTAMLAVAAVASLACGLAPGFPSLLLLLVVLGVTAAAAMVAVPLAASLAAPHQRGQVTGTVMSGLLFGILLARTVSGGLAELGGWRLVYFVAAAMMALLTVLVWFRLPTVVPTADTSYPKLLGSIGVLVKQQPVLRGRMLLGLLQMVVFALVWTASSFLLARTYHLSDGVIGLFGLVGAAGAFGAPVVGKFADKGRGGLATTISWLAMLLSWGLFAFGEHGIGWVIVGLLLFDLGAQAGQVSNQNRIYALVPEARSRITTAYMVTFFTGGVLGSIAAGNLYEQFGWAGICIAGAAVTAVGTVVWAVLSRSIEKGVV